jgi:hypothetical protein
MHAAMPQLLQLLLFWPHWHCHHDTALNVRAAGAPAASGLIG